MNAPARIDSPETRQTPTPADLTITPRDSRFGRGETMQRWWCNGDPVATAWMNSLSASFPLGEGLFIESVKAFRDDAPPRLANEIRAFVKQEVNHTREHLAFNRAAAESGYDMRGIEARIAHNVAVARTRPPVVQLGVTIALEHFTAMFAHLFLKDPKAFFDPHGPQADIWRWHAVEEIEHKGVAFDTYLHATRGWPRFRRWKLKSLTMLLITWRFITHRSHDALDMMAQDGITGWKARAKLTWYLVGKPGVLRRILPAWIAYFLPGFHPWNRDDRALIVRYESDFADAVMPEE
ncbi:metal-dependent hydrolase [Altererythrobacter salegens]|uniref:Metal-dependent hydrolase n=1 Tax=Croceibacterium salegens TaxID=1737568 RepID=A0A6I4SVK6_9SPHN|nr:metal-dependent hydrolase [Croceibacterium salegens]MXO58332.1 metal-dependent hydrolase [Croceibacterium salegens]